MSLEELAREIAQALSVLMTFNKLLCFLYTTNQVYRYACNLNPKSLFPRKDPFAVGDFLLVIKNQGVLSLVSKFIYIDTDASVQPATITENPG